MKPPRKNWMTFPDVFIHANESDVKQHAQYYDAKTGNADAALALVLDTLSEAETQRLGQMLHQHDPILVSAHAYEQHGVNAIPEVFAAALATRLNWEVDTGIVQTNVVSHTGADGFSRLARQAAFDGVIQAGCDYVLVDDFVGMGGTLSNLRGFIESGHGNVLAAVALTGKPHSAKLALTATTLNLLRNKHGDLEQWWVEKFGHTFDALTESEARYLVRTPDVATIRDRIIAAE